MRMMLRWTVPVEKGNAMVKDGSMGTIIETLWKSCSPRPPTTWATRESAPA